MGSYLKLHFFLGLDLYHASSGHNMVTLKFKTQCTYFENIFWFYLAIHFHSNYLSSRREHLLHFFSFNQRVTSVLSLTQSEAKVHMFPTSVWIGWFLLEDAGLRQGQGPKCKEGFMGNVLAVTRLKKEHMKKGNVKSYGKVGPLLVSNISYSI